MGHPSSHNCTVNYCGGIISRCVGIKTISSRRVRAGATRRSAFRYGLLVAGGALLLGGLFVSLLVAGMMVQPGGMGWEKLLVPLFGAFALLLFCSSAVCFYLGSRIKP